MIVYVLVEGQSEQLVIEKVIAPSLYHLDIYLVSMLMPTSKSNKGGAINLDRLLFNIKNLINQQTDTYITTFLDFYQLDNSFPEFYNIQQKQDIYEKIECLEQALHQYIIQKLNCRFERFIPHIQPYELEALFFSDVSIFSQVEPTWMKNIAELQQVVNDFETPEHINNHYTTAPSKRLENLLKPKYRKTRHAPLLAEKITLAKMEQQCHHFSDWLNKLRQLTPLK